MPVASGFWQKGRSLGFVLFFAFFLVRTGLCQDDTPPQDKKNSRWALGLGAGWIQDYPGAAQGRLRFLAFPVYRGEFFRIDRISGVSGDVYNNSKWDFSWNFIFQFPTASSDIPVREGMPNIDWLLSLGPQLKYSFFRTARHHFFFRFPIRANTCTNFGSLTQFCGVVFNPGFRHSLQSEKLGEFTFRLEGQFHGSEYQQYFFGVTPQHATPTRPAFHAQAGFLGFIYGFFHALPFEGWSLNSAFNLYDYSLAINHNSPLFLHKTNYAIFLAVTLDI